MSSGERCMEHHVALTPTGECVLCRREHLRLVASRWFSRALLGAGLGTVALGAVVVLRPRRPSSPVAEAGVAETVRVVETRIDDGRVVTPYPNVRPRDLSGAPFREASGGSLPASPGAPPPTPPQARVQVDPRAHDGIVRADDEPDEQPDVDATETDDATPVAGEAPPVWVSGTLRKPLPVRPAPPDDLASSRPAPRSRTGMGGNSHGRRGVRR